MRRRQSRVIPVMQLVVSVILFGLLFLAVAMIDADQPAMAAPPGQAPTQPPSLIRGAGLWLENCAPCHGTMGLGDGPTASDLEFAPTNLADPALAKERTLAAMFDVIKNGRMERFMPPWKERLNDQQIWDVAAYAQSLSVPRADVKAGQAVYAQACADCHGEAGVATEIDLTDAGLLANTTLQAQFDGLRAAGDVHESLADLSDAQLWQSLAFVPTLSVETPALDGKLNGRVRNGTTGDLVPNAQITLYALAPSGDILQTIQVTAGPAGTFSFEDLNVDHTISYALESFYQGVRYLSPEPVTFLPDVKELGQDLTVYETTEDAQVLDQQRLHRIMTFGGGFVNIADVYVFGNDTDRAYVGEIADDGLPATVKIGLPPGAIDVSIQDQTARPYDDHYLLGRPILPGDETMISVSYNVLADGDDLTLETPLFYEVPFLNILASDQGQTIEGERLNFEGTQSFQGNNYQLFSGADLSPEQGLVIQIKDLPSMAAGGGSAVVGGNANQNQTVLMWSLAGLGIAMLAFGLLYSARSMPPAQRTANTEEEKSYLLLFLSELEALHQSGEIDEATYRQLRAEKRSLLKQILLQEAYS